MAMKYNRHTFCDVAQITMLATCFDDGGFVKLVLQGSGGAEVVIEINTAPTFIAPKPIDLSAAQAPAMEAAQ